MVSSIPCLFVVKLFFSSYYCFLLAIPNMIHAQDLQITYELGMPSPASHLFEVSIYFENLPMAEDTLELQLPVWRPGRYFIFDFASGVQEFSVFGPNAKPLDWRKTSKSTWRIDARGVSQVSVHYKVYADEFKYRTRGLNNEHGFVDGTSVFMYSEKYRSAPVKLNINPYPGWHVTTGLQHIADEPNAFSAPSYDYFVDCPLEIGNQRDVEFTVSGRQYIFSLQGEVEFSQDTLIKDLRKIIEFNSEFWGTIPFHKYLFIVHCSPVSGGGTEHINSCVLGVPPAAFETQQAYKRFLRLVSHEFFHAWNAKQFRPAGLTPYDYSKENYTEELWIVEGGTSYYDALILVRTGQLQLDDFLHEISRAVRDERRRPGNRIQSLAESSFDAWIKYWKGTPNSYDAESDYYAKGAAVCLILDLEIRHRTNNLRSLDDVFRQLFDRFPNGEIGYTNSDFIKICEELSKTSFTQFFEDYLYGTKPIEWEKYLSYAGLELHIQDSISNPVLGILTQQRGDRFFVKQVLSGSVSESAGLLVDDEIVAIDKKRILDKEFPEKLESYHPGDSLTLTIFRGDKLLDLLLVLPDKELTNYRVLKTTNPSAIQKSIYESWLGVQW